MFSFFSHDKAVPDGCVLGRHRLPDNRHSSWHLGRTHHSRRKYPTAQSRRCYTRHHTSGLWTVCTLKFILGILREKNLMYYFTPLICLIYFCCLYVCKILCTSAKYFCFVVCQVSAQVIHVKRYAYRHTSRTVVLLI